MNIVFDLGGVLVRWAPDAIIAESFTDAGARKKILDGFVAHADWLELDRGTLAPRHAVARASARTGLPEHEIARFLDGVPASLTPIAETVELLGRLKRAGRKLFCLSNMHFASIDYIERTHAFYRWFDGATISCRLNLIKPEPAIYAHLLQHHGLAAGETVFIDDVEANVAAAARFGMRTIRFESAAQCEGALRQLGCIAMDNDLLPCKSPGQST